jgi:hypothetical protein
LLGGFASAIPRRKKAEIVTPICHNNYPAMIVWSGGKGLKSVAEQLASCSAKKTNYCVPKFSQARKI